MATPLTFSFTTAKLPGQLPATIWTTAALPATVAAEDSASVELGMKFRADVDGAITALRYYKAASNTGTHVGHIWSAAGVQLGSVVFANETQSGWQQANFAAPIPIAAGVTYVASYLAPVGQYSATTGGLGSAADAAPLHALASATSGGNGVYVYGAGAFPSQSFGSSNYWVDVVFVDNSAPSVTATSPAANATGVALGTGVTATFSEAMQPASIAFQLRDGGGNLVAGSLSYDPATFRATFQPTSALVSATTYTATVASALDSAGNPMAAPASWSFRTVDASRVTLFDARTPVVASNDDTSPLELGMRFKSTVAGNVLGVRFYKGPINTGAHVGHLWTEAGTLLASVNFSGESASGWQEATFSTPVAITPGTNYVVSYFAPAGGFALDYGFFDAGDFVNGPLVGIGNPTAPNGLFNYSAGGGFPTNSVGGSNYWVDVIFTAS
jgi:hypothetical protein